MIFRCDAGRKGLCLKSSKHRPIPAQGSNRCSATPQHRPDEQSFGLLIYTVFTSLVIASPPPPPLRTLRTLSAPHWAE
ncbi:hypothetical protein CEXT_642581 [Caerostris extrusa]|uniref:Uncharacterized protein n=1 Tax=Caerostris extrusa TaxID=172846 RepID=A0AAV4S531_CAEEX|nr:hypothetical protein CEXT_642581 [Caerostris extrusa]